MSLGLLQWFTVSSIKFLSENPTIEDSSGGNSLSINFIFDFYKILFIYSIGVKEISIFFNTVYTNVFSLWIADTSGFMYCNCFYLVIGRRRNLNLDQIVPESRLQFPTLVQLDLSNKSHFPRLHSSRNYPLVRRPALDGDVFGAGEVALKIDNFEILHIQKEEISFLLINNRVFLPDLNPRIQLTNLLFVQLHR